MNCCRALLVLFISMFYSISTGQVQNSKTLNTTSIYKLPSNRNGLTYSAFRISTSIRIERWEKNAQIILNIKAVQSTPAKPDPSYTHSYTYQGKEYGNQHVGLDPFLGVKATNLRYEVTVMDGLNTWTKIVDGMSNIFGPTDKNLKINNIVVYVKIVGASFIGTQPIERKIQDYLKTTISNKGNDSKGDGINNGTENSDNDKSNGNNDPNNSNVAKGSSNRNSANGNSTQTCPTFGFKLSGTPSTTCVAIEWWALSTQVNMIDASGNFKQSNDAQASSFTIQHRKQGSLNWVSETQSNAGRNNFTLTKLDPCTKYELRMITTCTNNVNSNPTTILRFETNCEMPSPLLIDNIQSNSAQVNRGRTTNAGFAISCPSETNNRSLLIEYRTAGGPWRATVCNNGSPCVLYALSMATVYVVRARFQYGSNLYSKYTNEVSFSTKGTGAVQQNISSGSTTSSIKAPILLGPINGIKITGYYFELSWQPVLNANSYEIMVAPTPTFSGAVMFNETRTSFPPSGYGQAKTLYWKVRAKNGTGQFSSWSKVGIFKF